MLTMSTSLPFCVPRSAPRTVTPDRQRVEAQGSTRYPTKRIVRVSTQFHPCQMLGYVEDGQRVTGEV